MSFEKAVTNELLRLAFRNASLTSNKYDVLKKY